MFSRRRFILLSAAALAFPRGAAASPGPRSLGFENIHTGERLSVDYWADGRYEPEALHEVDHILRDFLSGDVKPIDLGLLDLLHDLRASLGTTRPFSVISGYRSPATNQLLRSRSNGVALHSLHMEGRAIDVRVEGVALADLRRAALALGRGGVGYYPGPDFVHVDTGRVRFW